jgi:hypothetical protein
MLFAIAVVAGVAGVHDLVVAFRKPEHRL